MPDPALSSQFSVAQIHADEVIVRREWVEGLEASRDGLRDAARALVSAYMAGDEQGWLAAFNRLEELTGGQQHGS